MFGYVRPAYGELRVREHELYRAAYCGLCRSMGKCTGCASQMTLSYDLVFLALVRYALTGDSVKIRAGRCAAHPLKKRPYLVHTDSLAYSAGASAVLTLGKLRDDTCDERGWRRLTAQVLLPFARHAAKRADLQDLESVVQGELSVLARLESERCSDIDKVADCFGRLLGEVVSYGLDGAEARIAYEMGKYTGRFIYIIDAADDMDEDAKRGRYNPFLCAYGEDILEEREVQDHSGRSSVRTVPKRETAEGILTAARLDLMRLEQAENLISYEDSQEGGMLRGIIGNIIGIGMPGEMMRVLGSVSTERRISDTL